MPTLIGYHEVKDRKHWLASLMRKKFFGPLGIAGIREFIDPQHPTRVAVLMDGPDMAAFQAAMKAPAAAEAMAHARDLGDPRRGVASAGQNPASGFPALGSHLRSTGQ